jgi:hypothetical protein
MRDIPEFRYLKSFEEAFAKAQNLPSRLVSEEAWKGFVSSLGFTEDQQRLLRIMLKEQGLEIDAIS